MSKPVMVVMLVFVCTAAVVAQTASAVQVIKAPGEVMGSVTAIINGTEKTIAGHAYQAWLADDGRAVLYATGDSVGGYEREGQALWWYDIDKGCVRKLMSELYMITKVVETRSTSGEDALLVTMMDGGLGASHVAVVDPQRGEVWRETMARFVGLRNGRIAVGLYRPHDFGSEKPRPDRIAYYELDRLLDMPANPYVPVQTRGRIASVVGTVTYLERIALPPEAVVDMELVNVTTGRRIAQNTIIDPGQVPISFELFYDPSLIRPSDVYQINARIRVGNDVWFRNTTAYSVITGGNPNQVEMVLTRV